MSSQQLSETKNNNQKVKLKLKKKKREEREKIFISSQNNHCLYLCSFIFPIVNWTNLTYFNHKNVIIKHQRNAFSNHRFYHWFQIFSSQTNGSKEKRTDHNTNQVRIFFFNFFSFPLDRSGLVLSVGLTVLFFIFF